MDDLTTVIRHATEAQARDEEISDACARMIAAMWHGGQASDGYAFASSGAISDPDDVYRSLFGVATYAALPAEEKILADMMGTYLIRAGRRGPVSGWSRLWIGE